MTCESRRKSPACFLIAGAAALVLAPGFALADMITGSGVLNIGNGTVTVSGNGVTSGCIIWSPSPSTCPTSGSGSLTVESASSSPPFTMGDMGTIDNLNFNVALPLVDFITVDGVMFDLENLDFNGSTAIGDCTSTPGSDGLTDTSPGATCTPADSPFQITNGLGTYSSGPMMGEADTVSVQLTMNLWGYTGSSGTDYSEATQYVGIFTTQSAITDANIASILSTLSTPGGSETASWSATLEPLSSFVPEPASLLLCGMGLIGLGLVKRRDNRRRAE